MEYMRKFTLLNKKYNDFYKKKLHDIALTPNEVLVLKHLIQNPETDTVTDIARSIKSTPSLVSRSINGLVQKGLAIMYQDKMDRRLSHVKLNINIKLENDILNIDKAFQEKLINEIQESDLLVFELVLKQMIVNANGIIRD